MGEILTPPESLYSYSRSLKTRQCCGNPLYNVGFLLKFHWKRTLVVLVAQPIYPGVLVCGGLATGGRETMIVPR